MADIAEWGTSHSLPISYAKLRKVVANFLIRRGFYNHLHTFANLSELLAIAIDNDLSDTPNRVNIKLFKDAFKNGGTRNYVINCQDSFNFEGSFLVVSLGGAQVGSSASQREITSGAIGCFSTREDGINATITQWDAGKYMSVCIREGLGLDNDDVQEVIRAVKKQKQDESQSNEPSNEDKSAAAMERIKQLEGSNTLLKSKQKQLTKHKQAAGRKYYPHSLR